MTVGIFAHFLASVIHYFAVGYSVPGLPLATAFVCLQSSGEEAKPNGQRWRNSGVRGKAWGWQFDCTCANSVGGFSGLRQN
jgi:hypothetical protein